ncbi:hypothetical protein B296_00008020 [Ensete ventricosum]|uniref:Uncharacterized protein n=1 Tax=Ensete ventricosum TaxID=4639 RepID=A0A426XM06_ENSVE|nr:hypothetical protein B296_00008020 [Ensete ventricosum]
MVAGASPADSDQKMSHMQVCYRGVAEPMIGASKVVSLATSSSIAERVAEATTARGKSSRHSARSEVVAHVGEGAIPRLEAMGGHEPGEDVDREGNGAAGQLWRAEEDAILRTCMKQYGPREWNLNMLCACMIYVPHVLPIYVKFIAHVLLYSGVYGTMRTFARNGKGSYTYSSRALSVSYDFTQMWRRGGTEVASVAEEGATEEEVEQLQQQRKQGAGAAEGGGCGCEGRWQRLSHSDEEEEIKAAVEEGLVAVEAAGKRRRGQ